MPCACYSSTLQTDLHPQPPFTHHLKVKPFNLIHLPFLYFCFKDVHLLSSACMCPYRPEDDTRSHYSWIISRPCVCWELNSGFLGEQSVLLTTESSLQFSLSLSVLCWNPERAYLFFSTHVRLIMCILTSQIILVSKILLSCFFSIHFTWNKE